MLELKQTQKLLPVLKLTQQLQQAIKLLQLSRLDLVQVIEQELQVNPLLEVNETQKETDDETDEKPLIKKIDSIEWLEQRHSPSEEQDLHGREYREYSGDREWGYSDVESPNYENILKQRTNLGDYLRWQINLSNFGSNEQFIAEWIIENINDNGYLAYPIPEIAKASDLSVELLENVLTKIQKLDPPGIGARDLKECIYLQYEAKGEKNPIFEEIIAGYFDLLLKANMKEVSKKTGYPLEKIKEVLDKIKSFDPKPGRNYSQDFTSYIYPDVYVLKGENGFEVYLDEEYIPTIKMNEYYVNLYNGKNVDRESRSYIKNKMQQAEWFIKSIRQRQNTLYLVSKSIVAYQSEFFDKGIQFLKPLILKNVAQDIGVHESTVSRITTNKYVSAPNGIFEMKFFFPTGIHNEEGDSLSTNAVINFITEIINKEDKKNPVTDDDVVAVLKERHNVRIARRTVAKYREALSVRSSRERRVLD